MIFFLSPVGTVDRDTDFDNTNDNTLDCCMATSTVYTVQYVQDDNKVIGVNAITISDIATKTTTTISYGSQYGTTNILLSQRLKFVSYSTYTVSSTVQAIVTTITLRSQQLSLLSYRTNILRSQQLILLSHVPCTTSNIMYSSPSSSRWLDNNQPWFNNGDSLTTI